MEALFEKMKEYLNMETEISFEEFDGYYKEVVAFLEKHWTELNEDDSMNMLFILDNLKANAEERSQRKIKEAKKYKKMFERSGIWAAAIFKRLRDEFGWSEDQIGKRYEEIYEAV